MYSTCYQYELVLSSMHSKKYTSRTSNIMLYERIRVIIHTMHSYGYYELVRSQYAYGTPNRVLGVLVILLARVQLVVCILRIVSWQRRRDPGGGRLHNNKNNTTTLASMHTSQLLQSSMDSTSSYARTVYIMHTLASTNSIHTLEQTYYDRQLLNSITRLYSIMSLP